MNAPLRSARKLFTIGHSNLEVEDLLELRPAPDAVTRYPFVTLDWARQWPCEEVRKARKRR